MKLKNKIPVSKSHNHLMDEWDFVKNGDLRPEDLTRGSGKKVWWVCRKDECKHEWQTRVHKRTKKIKPTGCPACANQVVTKNNNLTITHPEFIKEWDFEKNDIRPEEVTYGSNKEVWWLCEDYKHSCKISIKTHIKRKVCLVCYSRFSSEKNNLLSSSPHLQEEWDFERNKGGPEKYTKCSGKKVWWVCKVCGCKWKAAISHRVNGEGCPAHAGRVVTEFNSLKSLFPRLAEEWDYIKNKDLLPENVTYGSCKKVWWVHGKDKPCGGYSWKAIINNRTKKIRPRGCPACVNKVTTQYNNLAVKFPELCKDWDYAYNDFGPEEVTPGSCKRVGWVCNTKKSCGHKWRTSVNNRVNGTGCPLCSNSPVSKISQRWLDSLGILQEFREYRIKDLNIWVDGFNPKTKTVYEFLGDYWHGNPEIFSPEEINPTSKKSFGQLYQETMERIDILKESGYKVIYIWEKDFKQKQGR